MLEKMDNKMEHCKHALLGNLERRRQRFPRFYFLSPEDVMNIVCYGYDLNAVNKYVILYPLRPAQIIMIYCSENWHQII